MKGYKVVQIFDDKFYSPNNVMTYEDDLEKFLELGLVVEYKVGEETLPPEDCGPLCVFTDYNSAVKWAYGLSRYNIFECEYKPSISKAVWTVYDEVASIEILNKMRICNNAVTADSVTLIKIV